MVRRRRLAVSFAALPLACFVSTVAPAAGPDDLGRLIDDVVMRAPSCIGLVVGVAQGSARAQRFYGETGNRGRPNADTEFEIGSITKTFTATLLAYEDQARRIRLDDPLARYAPPGIRVPSFDGQQILMAQLAEHTSGLPRVVQRFTPPLMPEAMWRFVNNYQLTRAPGEQFLYSNLGFGVPARHRPPREHDRGSALRPHHHRAARHARHRNQALARPARAAGARLSSEPPSGAGRRSGLAGARWRGRHALHLE
jgi:CubicO group peptidase (beta-lactamase class C family)